MGGQVWVRGGAGAQWRGRDGGGAAPPAQGERAAADGARDFKKSSSVLREGAAVKFAFIQERLAAAFPLEVVCAVLEVSRSGYYAWSKRPSSARARRREELAEKIQRAHEQ